MTRLTRFIDTYNLLVDSVSGNLTAVLDFELSHVASPAEEYFYSLTNLRSMLASSFDNNLDEILLRKCLLEGFDKINFSSDVGGKINWMAAHITDHEFTRAGVLKPLEVRGYDELASLSGFLNLFPPLFSYASLGKCSQKGIYRQGKTGHTIQH
jgi:hypothetical protein